MNAPQIRFALLAMSIALTSTRVQAVPYVVTLLHDPSFTETQALGNSSANQVGFGNGPNQTHALLWTGSAASVVNLTPAGSLGSQAYATSGPVQVGRTFPVFNTNHAAMWTGTAASFIDLHPAGYLVSTAYDVDGSAQVGYASTAVNSGNRAFKWQGSAASAVSLHPAGFSVSEAHGVSGNTQVGFGQGTATGGAEHALMWNGTAASAVDLHPAGYLESRALAASDTSQVGTGQVAPTTWHALLWSGSAASVIDLNPAGVTTSSGADVFGSQQVGSGYGPATNNMRHAFVWNGTAASAVDLHQYVQGTGYVGSYAFSIAPDGTIAGALYDFTGRFQAVIWTPVPEPSTVALLAILCTIATCARHRTSTGIKTM